MRVILDGVFNHVGRGFPAFQAAVNGVREPRRLPAVRESFPSAWFVGEMIRGLKEERSGGDDAIRPAFPADPSHLMPNVGWSYRLTKG